MDSLDKAIALQQRDIEVTGRYVHPNAILRRKERMDMIQQTMQDVFVDITVSLANPIVYRFERMDSHYNDKRQWVTEYHTDPYTQFGLLSLGMDLHQVNQTMIDHWTDKGHVLLFDIPNASGSDYSGDAHELTNYRYLLTTYGSVDTALPLHGIDSEDEADDSTLVNDGLWGYYGGHGTFGVLMDLRFLELHDRKIQSDLYDIFDGIFPDCGDWRDSDFSRGDIVSITLDNGLWLTEDRFHSIVALLEDLDSLCKFVCLDDDWRFEIEREILIDCLDDYVRDYKKELRDKIDQTVEETREKARDKIRSLMVRPFVAPNLETLEAIRETTEKTETRINALNSLQDLIDDTDRSVMAQAILHVIDSEALETIIESPINAYVDIDKVTELTDLDWLAEFLKTEPTKLTEEAIAQWMVDQPSDVLRRTSERIKLELRSRH